MLLAFGGAAIFAVWWHFVRRVRLHSRRRKIEPASQNSSEADPGSQNVSETFEYLMNILQCPGYDSDECMCNVLVTMLPTQVLYSLECFMSCIIW